MIVGGQSGIRSALSNALTEAGFRTIAIVCGEDAIALINNGVGVNAILTALDMLGDTNGWELARWIRKNHSSIPVLFTSEQKSELETSRPTLNLNSFDLPQVIIAIKQALFGAIN